MVLEFLQVGQQVQLPRLREGPLVSRCRRAVGDSVSIGKGHGIH